MRSYVGLVLLVGCGTVTSNPDAPPAGPMNVSVADLRQLPDGATDVTVDVTHTYLRQRNLHFQRDQGGPAVMWFVPAAEALPVIELGNTVKLHVTQMGTFQGNRQILAAEIVSNDGQRANIDALAQQLTVAPNEDLEGELVRIEAGTVVSHTPPNLFMVRLTSNTIIELFSPVGAQVGLCPNATFNLRAPVIEFMGAYEVASTVATDYSMVVTTACM
jgi:hypothetical protein